MNDLKPICITPGDPTGIGPEITVKFLRKQIQQNMLSPIIVLGSKQALEEQATQCQLPLPTHGNITYLNVSGHLPGEISYNALVQAIELIARNEASALVTGPISKANLHSAGISYSGHTEILQDLANQLFKDETKTHQADMLFVFRQFRMLLLTRHIALKDVSSHLTPETIHQSLNSLIEFLKGQAGISQPKLGILGVNPHAGEMQYKSAFCEERDIIQPVLDDLAAAWQIPIDPPLAADAAFRGFKADNPPYDCYVAPYHDQGLIPMKLVAGMHAVNVTIGLPFIRTSVSHGTAPDIAGKNLADETALEAAFQLAQELARTKKDKMKATPA